VEWWGVCYGGERAQYPGKQRALLAEEQFVMAITVT